MKYFFTFLTAVLISFSYFHLLNTKVTTKTAPLETVNQFEITTVTDTQVTVVNQEEEEEEEEEEVLLELHQEFSVFQDPQERFELPLEGATGFAAITLNVRESPTSESTLLYSLPAGTGFRILEEHENWWLVEINGQMGYVYHPYCFINLPDVLPSIVYNNTNASESVFTSSHLPIPNITGMKLYDGKTYNERLGREEYIMPVLYGTAKKLGLAQKSAKEEGKTLIIYEAYRPYEVQVRIREELLAFSQVNPQIKAGISTSPWSTNWFISTGISNHQRGYAVDVSLGKIIEIEEVVVGNYLCANITEYEEAVMPTPIHELSSFSKSMAFPVNSNNDIDWRSAPLSETMNESALTLRKYCTEAGFTPLASEWWHFNDLDYQGKIDCNGNFYLTEVFSLPPQY